MILQKINFVKAILFEPNIEGFEENAKKELDIPSIEFREIQNTGLWTVCIVSKNGQICSMGVFEKEYICCENDKYFSISKAKAKELGYVEVGQSCVDNRELGGC